MWRWSTLESAPPVGPSLLQTPHGSFVAPDNGLLSRVLEDYLPDPAQVSGHVQLPSAVRSFHLTNPDYWLHPVSSTFHGRDIFTPVAAHLSLGTPPESMGDPISDLTFLPVPQPLEDTESMRGEIIYCDVYGNLVSNIPLRLIEGREIGEIRIRGRVISKVSGTFNDTLLLLWPDRSVRQPRVPRGGRDQQQRGHNPECRAEGAGDGDLRRHTEPILLT